MNAPLDVVLPTPLTPTHLSSEVESNNSSIQMVTEHPVLSTESTGLLILHSYALYLMCTFRMYCAHEYLYHFLNLKSQNFTTRQYITFSKKSPYLISINQQR